MYSAVNIMLVVEFFCDSFSSLLIEKDWIVKSKCNYFPVADKLLFCLRISFSILSVMSEGQNCHMTCIQRPFCMLLKAVFPVCGIGFPCK